MSIRAQEHLVHLIGDASLGIMLDRLCGAQIPSLSRVSSRDHFWNAAAGRDP